MFLILLNSSGEKKKIIGSHFRTQIRLLHHCRMKYRTSNGITNNYKYDTNGFVIVVIDVILIGMTLCSIRYFSR